MESPKIKAGHKKSRYDSDFPNNSSVIPLGLDNPYWLYLILIWCIIFASCTIKQKVITPKVARIENTGKGYKIWVWYRDSWLVGYFKDLPDSIQKGKRITLYPGDSSFKRSRPLRAW